MLDNQIVENQDLRKGVYLLYAPFLLVGVMKVPGTLTQTGWGIIYVGSAWYLAPQGK